MKGYLFGMLIFFPVFLFSQNRQATTGRLVVEGKLQHVKDQVQFVNVIVLDGDGDTGGMDTVPVINNRYVIKLKMNLTGMITLWAINPSDDHQKLLDPVVFFSGPGKVTIISTDSFSNAKVTGSSANIAFEQLKAQTKPYGKRMSTIFRQQADPLKKDSAAVYRREIELLQLAISDLHYNYLRSHRTSPLVPYALDMHLGKLPSRPSAPQVKKVEAAYNRLSALQQQGYFGRHVRRQLDSYRMAVGMMAPAFTQEDTLGNAVSLASFKGRYVLIDFWASWCVPCRHENPAVVKAFNKFKDKGFAVLGVSLDRPGSKAKWLDAIHKDGLTWTHVSDLRFWDNKVARLYFVNAIPQNFLIDPDGKIIGKGLRGEALEEKLNSLF